VREALLWINELESSPEVGAPQAHAARAPVWLDRLGRRQDVGRASKFSAKPQSFFDAPLGLHRAISHQPRSFEMESALKSRTEGRWLVVVQLVCPAVQLSLTGVKRKGCIETVVSARRENLARTTKKLKVLSQISLDDADWSI
jgi:hypothetical protein